MDDRELSCALDILFDSLLLSPWRERLSLCPSQRKTDIEIEEYELELFTLHCGQSVTMTDVDRESEGDEEREGSLSVLCQQRDIETDRQTEKREKRWWFQRGRLSLSDLRSFLSPPVERQTQREAKRDTERVIKIETATEDREKQNETNKSVSPLPSLSLSSPDDLSLEHLLSELECTAAAAAVGALETETDTETHIERHRETHRETERENKQDEQEEYLWTDHPNSHLPDSSVETQRDTQRETERQRDWWTWTTRWLQRGERQYRHRERQRPAQREESIQSDEVDEASDRKRQGQRQRQRRPVWQHSVISLSPPERVQ